MFDTGIGPVHPAGGSGAQRTARVNTQQRRYRQQIIATRQIEQRQQPRILSNPRQDLAAVQRRQRQAQQAARRATHIAVQNIRMVQDQVPNPQRASRVLVGQTVNRLREVADIGRLSKLAQNTHAPLEHRVGALRALRSRYGIPVTQQNFRQFRQAQHFHEFLTAGKEGDTITVPTTAGMGGLKAAGHQTYQLRKVGGELQPVAVRKDRSLFDIVTGKAPHYFAESGKLINAPSIAEGFTHAGIDTAHYGAKAIPEGTVGTPLRKAVTEIAALGPNSITGLYGLGAAGVAAAGGNTQPIKDIAKSFTEDDPIGRLIAHGDFKAFAAHPGIAIAELFGGATALDRAAGRAARRGAAPAIRSYRQVPGTRLARQERYSKGYVAERVQRRRDVRTDAKYADLRKQAEAEIAAARAAEGRVVRGQKTVQRPARTEQVFDTAATRKSIARQERRRVDRPFIRTDEVKDFVKGAKYKAVGYHVTTEEAAKSIQRTGLDPRRARHGTFGLGVYSSTSPETLPGRTALVRTAVRLTNPLIVANDKAMAALKPFREKAVERVGTNDLRRLSVEMSKELQRAGYDGVVVKGAMKDGGDYILNFHPQDVRVVRESGLGGRSRRVANDAVELAPGYRVARSITRDPNAPAHLRPAADGESGPGVYTTDDPGAAAQYLQAARARIGNGNFPGGLAKNSLAEQHTFETTRPLRLLDRSTDAGEARFRELQRDPQTARRLKGQDFIARLKEAGYDGVAYPGVGKNAREVVIHDPSALKRVAPEKLPARRGGRTSAVLERSLPAETRSVPGRAVRVTTTERVGRDPEAMAGHTKKAQGLAEKAQKYNRGHVREGFDFGNRTQRSQLRGDLERLGDVTEGANQQAARHTRAGAIREVLGKRAIREKNRQAPVLRKNDAEAEVQGLIAEGRVAPHRAELAKLADRIESQAQHLTDHHDVATNRHVVQAIREVLRTHDDQGLRLLGDDARRYATVNVRAHDVAKAHDLGTAEEFDMSAAKPFAVEQMGARPNAQGKLVVTRKAPVDLSYWEKKVKTAADDLKRAKERGLGGLVTKEQRLTAARRELEAQKAKGRTTDVEHVLTLDEIHAAMNAYADKFPGALRPGEQAFISHSSKIRGSGVFNIRADTAKGLSRARRTGNAVVYGTASVGRDAMLGAVVKLHNMAQAVRSFRQTIEDAAGRDPRRNGGVIAEDTAEAALKRWNDLGTDANGLPKPGFVEGQAVRLNPLGGRQEQLARTLHDVDEEGFGPGERQQALAQTITEALEGKDVGAGPWTVIPKEFADRLREHSQVSAGASPFLRTISQAFRKTVLPFSPTWITGNALESGLRGAIAGWRPGDSELERRVISEWSQMDVDRAVRLGVMAIGTGHMGSVDMWAVRNTVNSIKGPLRPIYALGEKLVNAKRGGKQVQWGADAVRAYTDWMMNGVNGMMESAIKRGLVGTQMRKLFLDPKLPKLSEEAVRSIAGELHSNPAAVQELISAVQRAYGAYEHFTPEIRRTIINYTPFGAWVFNAVTFLTRVLPADHPGLVALLAANDSATRQYRRDNGLDATLAGEKDSGQVPPFLLGSVPTPAWYARLTGTEKGAPLRLARYTPFGIMTDPTSSIASMFLPQIPLEVLQGYDFAGRPLRNKDGSPYDPSQLASTFALNFAMGTIPLFGQIARGFKSGPLAVVNPFQPVKRREDSGGSKKSSTGGLPSWGGGGGSGSSGGGLPAW